MRSDETDDAGIPYDEPDESARPPLAWVVVALAGAVLGFLVGWVAHRLGG